MTAFITTLTAMERRTLRRSATETEIITFLFIITKQVKKRQIKREPAVTIPFIDRKDGKK